MGQVSLSACPRCSGRGKIVRSQAQAQDPDCPLCEGRTYVPDKVCRGCGRPAYHERRMIHYCGREECFELLIKPPETTQQTMWDRWQAWRDWNMH